MPNMDTEELTVDLDIEYDDELLARLAHRLWAEWTMAIASEEPISNERVERWQEYWVPYHELPESVQQTDRELVERLVDETPEYSSHPLTE